LSAPRLLLMCMQLPHSLSPLSWSCLELYARLFAELQDWMHV